jgi:hypothetical protein
MVAKIARTRPSQPRVHGRLPAPIAQRGQPIIKRHASIIQFQFPDFPFCHRSTVN